MKRFIAGFLCATFLFSGAYAAQQYTAQQATFDIYVNGEKKSDWETPPLVVNGRTMLSLKEMGETLDVEVNWDGSNKRVLVGDATVSATSTEPASPSGIVLSPQPQASPVGRSYKGTMISEGLEIKISGKLDYPSSLRYHEFQIKNISNTDQEYDANYISCTSGQSYVFDTETDGMIPLGKGILKPGETVIGVVAFGNEQLATNAPEFRYKNAKIRIID